MSFIDEFNKVQKEMNQISRDHGWYDEIDAIDQSNLADSLKEYVEGLMAGCRLSLMHSELSEALEGARHGDPASDHIKEFTAMEEELADVIIRAMDFAQDRGLRLAEAIIAKAEFNRGRPHKHGGKKI